MLRVHSPFYGKRFIGDTSKNIVHDLLFEKKHTGDCLIDEIKTIHIKTFSPDKLEQAQEEGFKPCERCLMFNQPPLWGHWNPEPSKLRLPGLKRTAWFYKLALIDVIIKMRFS